MWVKGYMETDIVVIQLNAEHRANLNSMIGTGADPSQTTETEPQTSEAPFPRFHPSALPCSYAFAYASITLCRKNMSKSG